MQIIITNSSGGLSFNSSSINSPTQGTSNADLIFASTLHSLQVISKNTSECTQPETVPHKTVLHFEESTISIFSSLTFEIIFISKEEVSTDVFRDVLRLFVEYVNCDPLYNENIPIKKGVFTTKIKELIDKI